MHWYLTRLAIGPFPKFELTRSEFDNIKSAKIGLATILQIEEKYNILKENYAEFEKELLDIALSHSMFTPIVWSASMEELYAVNRRLANFLTTARLYLDQVSHDLSTLYGSSTSIPCDFKVMTNLEYDNSIGYRVMEALRNYIQHRKLPLVRIGYPSWWYPKPVAAGETDLPGQIRHVSVVEFSTKQLREDGGIKAAVLKELEEKGDLLDVRPFVREYMEALTRIHVGLRAKITADADKWTSLIKSCLERVLLPDETIRSAVIEARDEKGKIVNEVFLSHNQLERKEWLTRRNDMLPNLAKYVVSNEVRTKE